MYIPYNKGRIYRNEIFVALLSEREDGHGIFLVCRDKYPPTGLSILLRI
jgi:hypothetical protein